jgi:diacylglycerol kinase (ATP)
MLISTHPLTRSFKYAFEGLAVALKKGRNYRIQTALGVLAVLLGIYTKLSYTEWAVLAITISLVLIFELINTAIEAIVDIVSPEIRDKAKIAKDVAAASVLISSFTSLAVGALLFLPKIF